TGVNEFHKERDGGKVVPLEVVTKYIFDNHEHYGEDGVAMVESVALEQLVLHQGETLHAEVSRKVGIVDRMERKRDDLLSRQAELLDSWHSALREFGPVSSEAYNIATALRLGVQKIEELDKWLKDVMGGKNV